MANAATIPLILIKNKPIRANIKSVFLFSKTALRANKKQKSNTISGETIAA